MRAILVLLSALIASIDAANTNQQYNGRPGPINDQTVSWIANLQAQNGNGGNNNGQGGNGQGTFNLIISPPAATAQNNGFTNNGASVAVPSNQVISNNGGSNSMAVTQNAANIGPNNDNDAQNNAPLEAIMNIINALRNSGNNEVIIPSPTNGNQNNGQNSNSNSMAINSLQPNNNNNVVLNLENAQNQKLTVVPLNNGQNQNGLVAIVDNSNNGNAGANGANVFPIVTAASNAFNNVAQNSIPNTVPNSIVGSNPSQNIYPYNSRGGFQAFTVNTQPNVNQPNVQSSNNFAQPPVNIFPVPDPNAGSNGQAANVQPIINIVLGPSLLGNNNQDDGSNDNSVAVAAVNEVPEPAVNNAAANNAAANNAAANNGNNQVEGLPLIGDNVNSNANLASVNAVAGGNGDAAAAAVGGTGAAGGQASFSGINLIPVHELAAKIPFLQSGPPPPPPPGFPNPPPMNIPPNFMTMPSPVPAVAPSPAGPAGGFSPIGPGGAPGMAGMGPGGLVGPSGGFGGLVGPGAGPGPFGGGPPSGGYGGYGKRVVVKRFRF